MNLLDAALNIQNNMNIAPAQNIQQGVQKAQIAAQNLLKTASDTFAPIATTGLKTPDRPENSYIVDDPVYMAPVNFFNDIKENLINIKDGMLGKSNDHNLGRMNDFAMKAGALGLAGYLFTRGKTYKTKAMEFIGFGSFFAAMALWPKLFIQAPLKAMYGLDIHQRYVDNEGRKKMFFQDPQYIPWDLYSAEELSALGDRLGIPEDIHNRNEVIKKKAHKIALQGNTLWMLTAGFATPLLCALGCNGIERFFNAPSEKKGFPRNIVAAVSSAIEKRRIERAEDNVKNSAAITAKKLNEYNPVKLNTMLSIYKNNEISAKNIDKIADELCHDSDILLKEYVEKQIKDIVKVQPPNITREYASEFFTYIEKNIENYRNVDISCLDKESIEKIGESSANIGEFNRKISKYIDTVVKDERDCDALSTAVKELSDKFKVQKEVRVLSAENVESLRVLDKKLYEFSVKKGLLDKYNMLYFNNEAETIGANRWNNTANAFFKALGLNSEEVKLAKMGEDNAYKLVLKKLEKLAGDDEAYKKAFGKVYAAVLDFDKTVLPDAADGSSQGIKAILESRYSNLFDDYAKVFEDGGFKHIKERLVGSKITTKGCLKDNVLDRLSRRTAELRNGMYKFLQVLDFFKRVDGADKEGSKFAKEYFDKSLAHYGLPLHPTKETLKKDIEQYKALLVKGTIADYTTKSGMKNPQFALYDRMMKLIFNTNFADSTKSVLAISNESQSGNVQLGRTTFVQAFTKKINETLVNLGNAVYPHADKVKTQDIAGGGGDILVRDSLAGPRMDRVVRETASEVYNTSKWFKMFGGATAVLIGVTLFAEAFFGRMKQEDIYTKKDKH